MTAVLVVLVVGVLLYLVVKFVPMHPVIRAILVAPLPPAPWSAPPPPRASLPAPRAAPPLGARRGGGLVQRGSAQAPAGMTTRDRMKRARRQIATGSRE